MGQMSRGTLVPFDPEQLWQLSSSVLSGNWIGGHTVPAKTLYPHQWSWDTAFIAIGLAQVAPHRAWQDLHSLFTAQWPDGRVPHIVFDPNVSDRDYFPGRSFWGTPSGTTGIVQPPVHALAAWLVHQRQPAPHELRRLYPMLVKQQHYLFTHRDAGRAGLVSIVHPWESGLDNSPAWDEALSVLPADTKVLQGHRRRDIEVSVVSHRPTDRDYARYITLASAYRDHGYEDHGLPGPHPFLVECPAFNALTASAELALAEIAVVVGADPRPHRDRAAAISRAMVERLYNPETGMFHALDVRTEKRTPARCISGLIPIILPDLPEAIADSLALQAQSEHFGIEPLPAPSYDRLAVDFDPVRYWRGPIWINMNWLLWRGFLTHRRTDLADALRAAMLSMIAASGCFEYFHPVTGEGIGTGEFGWTASLALDLLKA
jgi:Mannosylglycerate hydrolase MGH1-like glycoside hydrolase domain